MTTQEAFKEAAQSHRPVAVQSEDGEGFVVLTAEDWRTIEETLFLNAIPGMVQSIHDAENEPKESRTKLKDLKW